MTTSRVTPVRTLIKLLNGQWVGLDNQPLPVKEGTIAELRLNRSDFSDRAMADAMAEKRRVEVLAEGTELRIALSVRPPVGELENYLVAGGIKATPYDLTSKISTSSRFISVTLEGPTVIQRDRGQTHGGLSLILVGTDPRSMESGKISLPKIKSLGTFDSLNEVFTRLSHLFEPWRKSNTGNIYERAFYLETDGTWYALNDFRERSLASADRAVLTRLWKKVDESFDHARRDAGPAVALKRSRLDNR